MGPVRMFRRQRLDVEHIEHRVLQMAAVEHGQQIRIDHMLAARQVHDACVRGQRGEEGGIQKAVRFGRQR